MTVIAQSEIVDTNLRPIFYVTKINPGSVYYLVRIN